MKKEKSPKAKALLIAAVILLSPVMLLGILESVTFVEDNITSYNEKGYLSFRAADTRIRPAEKSDAFSEEDVREALDIVRAETDDYFSGAEWLFLTYRTVWVEEIWHDENLDEITDDEQIIHIRADCYCCEDLNFMFNHGNDDTGHFTLTRADSSSEWELVGFGRC